jgi:diguanylate cyclase (GGDEF)-like protein
VAVILVVDSVAEDARAVGQLVQDVGHVIYAADAASALEQADEHWPDLVLLDLTRPGIDGREICARLRAQEHTRLTSVVFITDAQGQETEGPGPGAIDYLTKPLQPAIVRARVRNLLALAQARLDLRAANEALQRMAVTDPLTGLANRRRLIDVGRQELARAQRMPKMQSLICALVIDIDGLKAINEKDGHPAGDAMIAAVARACAETIRAIDTIGRLAGEEFAIVVPMTDCKGGVELAERLRGRIAKSLAVTISVGVAQGTPKTRSFEALLGAADEALNRAKKAGGNRVAATIYGNAEEVA